MNNGISPILNCDLSPEEAEAILALMIVMTPARVIQLAELILDIKNDTGYGDVDIVINDRRVERFKVQKSYP